MLIGFQYVCRNISNIFFPILVGYRTCNLQIIRSFRNLFLFTSQEIQHNDAFFQNFFNNQIYNVNLFCIIYEYLNNFHPYYLKFFPIFFVITFLFNKIFLYSLFKRHYTANCLLLHDIYKNKIFFFNELIVHYYFFQHSSCIYILYIIIITCYINCNFFLYLIFNIY